MANKFSKAVAAIYKLPEFCHGYLLTKLFCTQVKYAGTSRIKLQKVSNQEVVLTIANIKRVQNHIGGVHAIAASLLAESATGTLFGMNVPDSHLPLLKSMTVNYNRRMQGGLTAKAQLSEAQIATINSEEKGDMLVPVTITDESGQEPIECLMNWAWVPKKRK
ncbi:DUF4442 domain-containing protein [Thalassotalea euphylliae]|uniref:DUF4442 domain-containing protein n=1 Tax=Thalassotalea euphylliae TaxID=1655234 RepID=A0A3E0UL84_9GAMM|nr:DUF4442 domain-containing protein [Thalassotalea euphylliae]REL37035.1 DUF4442 domain-containing protein [Thalassotalea euphylliae]